MADDLSPATEAELEALRRENARLRAEIDQLRLLADQDVLTPTLNRRAFLREVRRALSLCRRHGHAAAVLYLDLDGFKGVNDQHGHLAGDAALRHVAELLRAHVRDSDVVARLGGDEFGVLLLEADLDAAKAKAEGLAELIAREPFAFEGKAFTLGGSFGVRAYAGQESAEAWLDEADAAMFVRKRGR